VQLYQGDVTDKVDACGDDRRRWRFHIAGWYKVGAKIKAKPIRSTWRHAQCAGADAELGIPKGVYTSTELTPTRMGSWWTRITGSMGNT
jgi:hypothetical protein